MTSIRHICMFYSELGGVERAVMNLVDGLKHRHEVDVLCSKHGRGVQIENVRGVTVTRAGSPLSIAGRPFSRSFIHHLAGTKADVLHYHLPCPLATIGHLTYRPESKVTVATWYHEMQRYPVVNAAQLVMLKLLFKDIDAIIVPSPAMIDNVPILAEFRDKCRMIPLGIDESLFDPSTLSESRIETLRQEYGTPLILFVGRLVYYKGCDILIRAMKKLDAKLVIVGEGPLEAELKHLADSLGIAGKIHFSGRIPDTALAHLYKACDVFVLPSTQRTECYGLVQVEAMLSSVPVINTALPTGVPWISQDLLTGLTVPPGDVEELVKAISKLLEDHELRKKLGQAGRKRALENFTLRQQIAATTQLYASLLSNIPQTALSTATY